MLSAAFSDHAYAVPPSKAPKTKPAVVTTTERPKPVVVTVGPSEIPDMPMIIRVPPMPSIVPQAAGMEIRKVFPVLHFGSFYPKNLVPKPQKLEVLSDSFMINPKLYLFIYRLVF